MSDKENAIKKGKKKENKKKLFSTIENENLEISDRSTEHASYNEVSFNYVQVVVVDGRSSPET